MSAKMFPIKLALALTAALCLQATAAFAQTVTGAQVSATATSGAPAMVRVDLTGSGASQTLSLPIGRSALVDLPVDARDVLVSNPGIADVLLRSPRRISVIGMHQGTSDAVFFDAAGRRILSLSIHVDVDTAAIGDMINRMLPGSRVHADGIGDSIILSGQVASSGDADKAVQIARAGVAKPDQVLNMMSIAGKDQVMLKVRIVEMQREVIKQLGFNMQAVLNQLGQPQYLFGSVATFGVNGALLGGLNGGYSVDTTKVPEVTVPCAPGSTERCPIVARGPADASNWETATIHDGVGSSGVNKANATIQAFERVGLVRTLAEPNLTAISGESAKFLAGGEFPVPTGQDSTGKVTIEFKPFGVGLGFTPVVLTGGRISLKISTEVSELSNQGAFSLTNGNGAPTLVVPSLTVRRAETTVELPSGGAMMIAGLLQDKSKQDLDSVPGMMNLPVLGALFRSRDYLAGQTELVVIVTPYIVNPTSPQNLQTPVDGLRTASEPETVLLGQLNKTYKHAPAATAGRTYQGPYGYVVE